MKILFRFVLLILVPAGCPAGAGVPDADTLQRHAAQLAHEFLVIDTHVDFPSTIAETFRDPADSLPSGNFDLPRARTGGLDAAFMSIFIPASYEKTGGGRALAERLIASIERVAAKHPRLCAIPRSAGDVRKNAAAGIFSLPLGMENGTGLEGRLSNVGHFHDRGIRYITLAHAENNRICDASYDRKPRWRGLSPFGRKVVAEMNRVGIMIDISHVTDSTAVQVLRLSRAPVIASHSACRVFTPGWERNISDELIRAVAAKGGVIQVCFGSRFLGSEFRNEHPARQATAADVAAHIDHVVKIAGIACAGFGSDFDGVGTDLPVDVRSVADYPNVIAELLKLGYSDEDIREICGENLLRVWEKVEQVAHQLHGATQGTGR